MKRGHDHNDGPRQVFPTHNHDFYFDDKIRNALLQYHNQNGNHNLQPNQIHSLSNFSAGNIAAAAASIAGNNSRDATTRGNNNSINNHGSINPHNFGPDVASSAAGLSANNTAGVRDQRNQLSIEERTKRMHGEPHGVNTMLSGLSTSEQKAQVNPELLKTKLQEVAARASSANFDPAETTAYRKALAMDPAYVESIQKLCLRADRYESNQAAARLISFFTLKQRLFGDDKLVRDIVLADLGENDIEAFRQGRVLLLPGRDRAGRAVIVATPFQGDQVTAETWSRLFYYVSMFALQDEDTQINGVVFVMYSVGQKEFLNERPTKLANIWWLIPVKLGATHVCYDANVMHLYAQLSSSAEGHQLCRFQSHFGTYFECTYSLMAFGIPQHIWPAKLENGQLDIRKHLEWLGLRNQREQQHQELPTKQRANPSSACNVNENKKNNPVNQSKNKKKKTSHHNDVTTSADTTKVASSPVSSGKKSMEDPPPSSTPPLPPKEDTATTDGGKASSISADEGSVASNSSGPAGKSDNKQIAVPGAMDIVMGRGRHPRTSLGHLRLQNIVEDKHEEYDRASKFEKTVIANIVVKELHKMGCRFIKATPEGYYVEEADTSVSRDKVSHAFRNRRKKQARAGGTGPDGREADGANSD